MKISKKAQKRMQKILNMVIILMIIVQPVSAPIILRAMVTEEPVIEAVSPPVDEIVVPVAEDAKKVEAPVVETKAVVEAEAPVAGIENPTVENPVTEEVTVVTDEVAVPVVEDQTVSAVEEATVVVDEVAVPVVEDQTVPVIEIQANPDATISEVAPIVPVVAEAPKELWAKNGNKATTNDPVELNKAYVAPQNDQVTVTFTKLPENSGTLSIEEVKLTDAQVALLGAASNVAFDITSTMENGTFAYDLTLPSVDGEKVGISYVEKSVSEIKRTKFTAKDVSVINEDKIDQKNNTIEAADIDHFTLFFTTIVPTASTATLTLTATVVGGGPAVPTDWELTADAFMSGGFSGDSPVTATVNAGETYLLQENTIPAINTTVGYTASSWSCDSGIVPSVNGSISLIADSNVTCTIVNTFVGSATLTLINNILGGTALPTDWEL